LQGGIELRKPDRQFDIENKPQAYARAATDNDVLDHFAVVLEDWCNDIESILGEQDRSKVDSEESGPDTEFEYWRNRMAKFNSIAEQLKRKGMQNGSGCSSRCKTQIAQKMESS
jgi:hypothetical protein